MTKNREPRYLILQEDISPGETEAISRRLASALSPVPPPGPFVEILSRDIATAALKQQQAIQQWRRLAWRVILISAIVLPIAGGIAMAIWLRHWEARSAERQKGLDAKLAVGLQPEGK